MVAGLLNITRIYISVNSIRTKIYQATELSVSPCIYRYILQETELTTSRIAPAEEPPARVVSDPWAYFECALESCIGAMEPGEILILSRRSANQYVQLFHQGAIMVIEAASNAYIHPPQFLLERRQYKRAIEMGWMAPTISGEDFDARQKAQALGIADASDEPDDAPVHSPNFHTVISVGAPYLTSFLLETLRRVYKVRKPAELQYQSFEADDNTQIKWPTLGIPRRAKNV